VYNFGGIQSRNLRVYAVNNNTFCGDTARQKWAYHAKYFRMSWTYLDLLYRFGRRIGRDDYSNISLAVAQETLPWQPVKIGKCSQTLPGTLLRHSTTDWLIVNLLSKD